MNTKTYAWCILTMFASAACADRVFTAHPEILVVDGESEAPVADAEVVAIFKNPPRAWGALGGDKSYRQRTDGKGRCAFEGKTSIGKVNCAIEAKGFYPLTMELPVTNVTPKWELVFESAVITCALQRVNKPVPLFVNRAETPSEDCLEKHDSVSYDLLIGDWLPPLGTGVVADVILTPKPRVVYETITTRKKEVGERWESCLEVTFPGAGNGIVEMKTNTRWQKITSAPAKGYANVRVERRGMDSELYSYQTFDEYHETQMCFRVRAKVAPNGNVVGGNYGKINGGFLFGSRVYLEDPTKVSWVDFIYCVNPTPGSRNLEYDRTNLCPTAPKDEWWTWKWL